MHSDLEQRRRAMVECLRALPKETAQPYDWAEFQRRARARRAVRRGALGTLRTIGAVGAVILRLLFASGSPSAPSTPSRVATAGLRFAAAAAVLGLVLVAVWGRFATPDSQSVGSEAGEWAAGADGAITALATSGGDFGQSDVQRWAAQQRAVEQWLARQPHEPVVVRVGTRAVVAGLEDQIAQLDDLMSVMGAVGEQPAKLFALEQQRARLVNSLVQVRYAETVSAEAR